MTREEAIDYNKNLRMYMRLTDKNQPYKFLEENYIALDMAIKALEQETCEDAISRQGVLEKAINVPIAKVMTEDEVIYRKIIFADDVEKLPFVTPQPKYEDIAKAFQFGLAFGFGEKYNKMDKVMEEVKKAVTLQHTDAEIQRMQELEQAELQKACEIGRELERMEQETCEDKYIKVPKKALKYRTAGMVAYNAEWLKDHFDIERAVICGAQQPCDDAISRQAAIDAVNISNLNLGIVEALQSILAELPPVTPQPKMGKWTNGDPICPCCGEAKFKDLDADIWSDWQPKYCPNCGAKMEHD